MNTDTKSRAAARFYKRRIVMPPSERANWKRGTKTNGAVRSLSEVAAILGCSKQSVQQVERIALYKLRKGLMEAMREINPELCREVMGCR